MENKKFEYKLKYDFITKELSFEITDMPEDLREKNGLPEMLSKKGNVWTIQSIAYPDISKCKKIYLRGSNSEHDCSVQSVRVEPEYAVEAADVLEKFQQWVEDHYSETTMTIAEIEAKLGIKNLKIIKEN